VDRAEDLGCDALQVFTQSPRTWRPTAHAEEALERFRDRRAASSIEAVACHAVYLVNLASSDPIVHANSVAAMGATMATATGIGADAVVFHLGSHLGAGLDAGLARAAPPLRELLERTNDGLWLCLENCAGQGGTIGRSVAELAAVFDAVERHPRLGLCIDSCHWYASGVDVTDPTALDEAVSELDARIGLDRLRCLHVNDSKAPLGSNRDRHDSIGCGLMGDRMGVFLAHPAFQGLPAILETPGPEGHGADAAEVQLARDIHARAMVRA
jgi:deoxyribonuclease IV